MHLARERRRFGDAALEQLQIADHDAEQIVEVVRDAAGELADRFHLLRLQQPRFEALLLGQVVDDREEADAPRRSAPICGTKWVCQSRVRPLRMARVRHAARARRAMHRVDVRLDDRRTSLRRGSSSRRRWPSMLRADMPSQSSNAGSRTS